MLLKQPAAGGESCKAGFFFEPPADAHGFAEENAALQRKSGAGNAIISVSLMKNFSGGNLCGKIFHRLNCSALRAPTIRSYDTTDCSAGVFDLLTLVS